MKQERRVKEQGWKEREDEEIRKEKRKEDRGKEGTETLHVLTPPTSSFAMSRTEAKLGRGSKKGKRGRRERKEKGSEGVR